MSLCCPNAPCNHVTRQSPNNRSNRQRFRQLPGLPGSLNSVSGLVFDDASGKRACARSRIERVFLSHGFVMSSPASARSGRKRRPIHPEISVSVCLDNGTPIPARLLELARMDLRILSDRPLRFGTPLQISLFSDLISAVTQNRAIVHWCRPHEAGWQIGAFLTTSLPDRLTENAWNDLRNTLRYDCNWKAWILWNNESQPEATRIVNYSISGLRLEHPRPVAANSPFILLNSAAARDRAILNGRVHWCRSLEDQFQIGCLIDGQRGRDLPKMFGNLAAVHVETSELPTTIPQESEETLRCELSLEEHFLSPAQSNHLRRVRAEEIAELLD